MFNFTTLPFFASMPLLLSLHLVSMARPAELVPRALDLEQAQILQALLDDDTTVLTLCTTVMLGQADSCYTCMANAGVPGGLLEDQTNLFIYSCSAAGMTIPGTTPSTDGGDDGSGDSTTGGASGSTTGGASGTTTGGTSTSTTGGASSATTSRPSGSTAGGASGSGNNTTGRASGSVDNTNDGASDSGDKNGGERVVGTVGMVALSLTRLATAFLV
ncbi:hypothetical protein B0H13DRAFT_1900586 [Mycena leptocephala]|nr:hypothetical protein B0H13DRAFT_1900586 [Mycena leptocephala]